MHSIRHFRSRRRARRIRTVALATLLAAAFPGAPTANAQDAVAADSPPASADSENPFVREGYAQFQAGNPDAALDQFQKALQANRKDVSALLGRAMIFAEQERHQDAFSAFDAIVDYYPQHAFAWNGRGLAAFNMEDFDEALDSFEQATADQPVNGFFYESLAWTQMCRGEFQNAAESAKTATLMYHKKGETAVYPLLIAYFSYLEAGDEANASRTLDYSLRNKPERQWPAPVIDYLAGAIDAPEMISYVTDTAQETEAHTYIGLTLRTKGEREAAARHLDWVSREGDSRVFEYTLARTLNTQHGVALR